VGCSANSNSEQDMSSSIRGNSGVCDLHHLNNGGRDAKCDWYVLRLPQKT